MFETLSEKLENSLKILKGEGKITEINIAETLKSIRKTLIEADVNYNVAVSFINTVKEKAIGQNVLTSIKPNELMIKIVHNELSKLMGENTSELNLSKMPAIILISGLQGSGKTTFSGKLAKLLKEKKNKRPLLVADDIYRPAAIEQLKIISEQAGVNIYYKTGNNNPIQIAKNAVKEAIKCGNDVIIIDTAGRLAIDKQMMGEIASIKSAIQPSEILFVVDAMTGQDAVNTAKKFNEQINFTGIVLTKLDGDTRGGAALSIRSVVNKPIKFVSKGEKLNEIDVFHPKRMADRILGMGDIISLVEKAQEQYDEKIAKHLQKKIAKDQFDFNDFLSYIQKIKKMGNLKDLIHMIPGLNKNIKSEGINDHMIKSAETIICAMTPSERSNSSILNRSRKIRIAKGSGKEVLEINQFLNQFEQIRKIIRKIKNKKIRPNLFKQN